MLPPLSVSLQDTSNNHSIQDFFDRIYVINLPNRRDRRQEIIRQLQRLGIQLQPGQVELFPAIRPIAAGQFPSIGAYGCFLSHYAILQQMRTQGLRQVLILEDDLSFTQSFVRQSPQVLQQLATHDWDMAYFGHEESLPPTDQLWVPYSQPVEKSHFYAIHQRILDDLLEFLTLVQDRPAGHADGGPMHIDGAYTTFRQQNSHVRTWLATPSQGFQRSSRSDIFIDLPWFDRIPGLRDLAQVARHGKNWLQRR